MVEQWQNSRKVKLLEILQIETNQKSSFTTNRHRSKLADIGIPCGRRTVSQNVDDVDDGEDIKAKESFSL